MRDRIVEYSVFGLIFMIYFISSVGLMNSTDTTQFYTAEALIQNGNVNMEEFESEPYYFVYPDIFYMNGKTYNVRGFLVSLLHVPSHIVSESISPLYDISNFPSKIIHDQESFRYQLSVVSLFCEFSILGLYLAYCALIKLNVSRGYALINVFILAFGTYIWKYSTYYTRHGISLVLLGGFLYSVSTLYRRNRTKMHNSVSGVIGLITAIAYGVDIILFIALIISITLMTLNNKYDKKLKFNIKPSFFFSAFALMLIFIITLNLHFYSSFRSSYVHLWEPVYSILGEATSRFIISAPFLIVVPIVLFNFGNIPKSAFSHFEYFPLEISKITSVQYAKEYEFWGMFIITPILFLIFILPFSKTKLKEGQKRVVGVSLLLFFLGVLGNSFIFGFWGGNQYDIRYFYPYVLLLVVPIALLTQIYWNKLWYKFLFVFLSILSIINGWVSVVNMYMPALTGERRIWHELYTLSPKEAWNPTLLDYVNFTFMNYQNFHIALLITVICILFTEVAIFLRNNYSCILRTK